MVRTDFHQMGTAVPEAPSLASWAARTKSERRAEARTDRQPCEASVCVSHLAGDLGVHGHKVVRVHDGVDQAVEHDGEVDVPVVVDAAVEPVEEEDGGVVVDVEEGELIPLLADDDEDGIPEVPD